MTAMMEEARELLPATAPSLCPPVYTARDYAKQMLIAGILLTIHNFEESLGFYWFKYPAWFQPPTWFPLAPPSNWEMITAIIIVTAIFWLAITSVAVSKKLVIKRFMLTAFVMVFMINTWVPHILGSIVFLTYFPGVVTAVILYLPAAYLMFPKLYKQFESRRTFLFTAAAAFGTALSWVGMAQGIAYIGFHI
ncbi:hypothetical protein PAPYR_2152 [Paratrimastix pyriformis]|uniref:HXXEE domain-containing protein n=1 Tax=Paratrimastix pyriformis TaxID=342808 RepID=A0ABQ8USN9_9EUKA|nr:hypothetical protein PAPYR_2152 [Paratrimastix pyriformis]